MGLGWAKCLVQDLDFSQVLCAKSAHLSVSRRVETHQFWSKALRERQEVPTGCEGPRSQTEMDSAKAYWLPITMKEEAIQLRGCTGMSPRPSHSAGKHKRVTKAFPRGWTPTPSALLALPPTACVNTTMDDMCSASGRPWGHGEL